MFCIVVAKAINDKHDALYVRGVVIPVNITDGHGDTTPDREGVKKIFSNYLRHETDINHSFKSNFNIHQLENTITTTETTINGVTVPVGSWVASHMVLDPEIIAMIKNNQLNGYSLGAFGNPASIQEESLSKSKDFLNNTHGLQYTSLKDYDDLNPFFISFVETPSNGFIWEVLSYTDFLTKSNMEIVDESIMSDNMTNLEETKIDDEVVKVSIVERLLGPLLNKSIMTKAAPEKEEEEVVVDDVVVDEPLKKEELKDDEVVVEKAEPDIIELINKRFEELPGLVANAVVDTMKELANATEVAEEVVDDMVKSESESESDETRTDDGEVMTKSDDPLEVTESEVIEEHNTATMTKSSSKLDEMPQKQVTPKNRFLDNEKRDEFGRVKKYL